MQLSVFKKIIPAAFKSFKKWFANPYARFGISWFRLKKLKHQGYDNPGVVTIDGISVHYVHPPELLHSIKEIFIDGVYNIGTTQAAPFIIDCGANIGLSVISLKKQFPDAKILAFEPDTQNFALLQKNTNQLKDVYLENKAVWDGDEMLEFSMGGTQSSSPDNRGGKAAASMVKSIRLRNLLDKTVFFLKMDIEGAEYRVVTDCRDVLRSAKYIFIEYHGSFTEQANLIEILQILLDNGFKYYIKEATEVYANPFSITERKVFDVQLNIFAFH
jgi:FkbM family methyltransferase